MTERPTDHELALRAVQLLAELGHVLASITAFGPPSRARHHLEALRRVIGDLDQYAIRDQLHRRPIEWRIAPAGDGEPAALYATRPGLGSVSVALEPGHLQRHHWHYLGEIARQMTEALT